MLFIFFFFFFFYIFFVFFYFFFFQAEDGIRDLTVTGVQTCALPILALVQSAAQRCWTGPTSSSEEIGSPHGQTCPAASPPTRLMPPSKDTRLMRSEERRVGKECRSRRAPEH